MRNDMQPAPQIHIVTHDNSHLYKDQMEDTFRIRYAIYVKGRGWKALDRPDKREIDQFDTEQARYLVVLEGSRVIGGMRMVPTTAPTLMSDLFPQLCIRPLIRRPDVFELSRIFVIPEKRGEKARPHIEDILLCGIMEYGLEEGIAQFTIVLETWWLPRLQDRGWRVTPLGLPEDIDSMSTIAVAVEVADDSVAQLRQDRGITGTLLVRQGLERLRA
jgi:acyl-homoserine lactone synthase